MNSSNQVIQSLSSEIQGEYQRISSVTLKHDDIIPKLYMDAQAISMKLSSVERSVEQGLMEMDDKLKRIKESGLNSIITLTMIDTVNKAIMHGASRTRLEYISQQIEELSQVVCAKRFITDDLRSEVVVLHERIKIPG